MMISFILYHIILDQRPPRVFFVMHSELRRIVLKFCIAYGACFAQFLVKKFDRVMSGHGAMTSQEVQRQAILREIAEYGTLEGDIEAFLTILG